MRRRAAGLTLSLALLGAYPAYAVQQTYGCGVRDGRANEIGTFAFLAQTMFEDGRPVGPPLHLINGFGQSATIFAGWYGSYPSIEAPFNLPPSFAMFMRVDDWPRRGSLRLSAEGAGLLHLRPDTVGRDGGGLPDRIVFRIRRSNAAVLLARRAWQATILDSRGRTVRTMPLVLPLTEADLRAIHRDQVARLRPLIADPRNRCEAIIEDQE